MSNLIEVKNLHVSLPSIAGDVHILRGLDFEIGKGEVVGMTGPSGSGKSTLLMVMAGLEPATQGRVQVAAHDYTQMDEDALARFRRTNVGIVFQSFHLVPTMTAVENVALPLELAGIAGARTRAEAALEEVGLGHRTDHYPAQLSGGEQQRTALARAVVADPPILLADEPTGNLDQSTGAQIMDLILSMAETRDTTLMLITHDPVLAEKCGRVIGLRDGQIETDSGAK